MNTKSTALLIAVVAVLGTACAKPPTLEIDSARAALESAATAEAEEYASGAFEEAQTALELLDDELTVQEGKFALVRNYDKATELAAAALNQAQAASSAAIAEKEAVQAETRELIAATQTSLVEVRELLANAPKGKGSEADLAMLSADLLEAEGSLMGIETSITDGDLYDARTAAQVAYEAVQEVKRSIEEAQARRSGGRQS